jgi:hypothetical protein
MIEKFIYLIGLYYIILAAIVTIIIVTYQILNYTYKRFSASHIFFDWIVYRKEFKKWLKDNKL